MPDIIHLLPESVANQIAAGEVVQRPASVVKELIENSIDAGSRSIKLLIREAGKNYIQVSDDGCGLTETDARMCFERHATSKIFKAEDLFNIRTLGFRGEALASIAAVARVELKTKRAEDDMGTQVVVEGSEVVSHEPIACPAGTSITVKNLFYNIPVRKNFLKANSVEYKHILDVFFWVALAHPELQFILVNEKTEVFHLNSGTMRQRVLSLFGKKYDEIIVPVEEKTPIVNLSGFVGKPDQARKARGEQYMFANNRFIRNPYFNHALVSAYEQLLPAETYPFYVLFLELPTDKIDVNIHPTKTEVKFEDERAIYMFIKTAVRKSLNRYHIAPSLDFEQETFNNRILNQNQREDFRDNKLKIDFGKPLAKGDIFKRSGDMSASEKDWKELLGKLQDDERKMTDDDIRALGREPKEEGKVEGGRLKAEGKTITRGQDDIPFEEMIDEDRNADETLTELEVSQKKPLMQMHNKYILTTIRSGVVIIHQQNAHQRILFEEYLNKSKSKMSMSQKQLFPEVLDLNPKDFGMMKDIQPELEALGFTLEVFGKKEFLITGLPADIKISSPQSFIEKMLEDFTNNLGNSPLNKAEIIARSLASQASIRTGDVLSDEEMATLIDKLFACENPNYSPMGKPIFMKIEQTELDKKFE